MLQHKIKRYGWVRDRLDKRDVIFQELTSPIPLPVQVDLRSQCPPVFNQGDLGSCTANALAAAVGFIHPGLMASRLFIYYNERSIEHTIKSDSGAQIRDGIKSLARQGVCTEDLWPYDITKFEVMPDSRCYEDAKKDIIKSYTKIIGIFKMRSCLAQGFPFVFGFSVYESFESKEVAKTGILHMPRPTEQLVGGHAVMAVGYDDHKKMLLVRNSWGTSWGIDGYFWMPYEYASNWQLVDDAWAIKG